MAEVGTQKDAKLVTTAVGQPNIVVVDAPAVPSNRPQPPQKRLLMQMQNSFLTSKRFYGFAVAEAGVVGGMLTVWAKGGVIDRIFVVTGIMALTGPLFALYGGIVAQGPMGLTSTDMVEDPTAKAAAAALAK